MFEHFQFSIDTQVIRFLFREIDAWIEDNRFARDTRSNRLVDLQVKETLKSAKNI